MNKPVYEAIIKRDDASPASIRTDNEVVLAAFLRAFADQVDPTGFRPNKPNVVYRSGLENLEAK